MPSMAILASALAAVPVPAVFPPKCAAWSMLTVPGPLPRPHHAVSTARVRAGSERVMSDSAPHNVIVLTQRGRFPSAADITENPQLAIASLRTESLRLEAEAYTCLSQYLESLIGDRAFDRERFDNLARRLLELRSLVTLAELAAAADSQSVC